MAGTWRLFLVTVFRDLASEGLPHCGLEFRTKQEHGSRTVLVGREEDVIRAVVEEAVTLASLALFLGMIAVWAQVIPAL
jgi:hypothetical protein